MTDLLWLPVEDLLAAWGNEGLSHKARRNALRCLKVYAHGWDCGTAACVAGQVLGRIGLGCGGRPATDLHELRRKSQGGSDLDWDNTLLTCRRCHDTIHAHPAQARELGLILFAGDEIRDIPTVLLEDLLAW